MAEGKQGKCGLNSIGLLMVSCRLDKEASSFVSGRKRGSAVGEYLPRSQQQLCSVEFCEANVKTYS